jgi:hypothetical protein
VEVTEPTHPLFGRKFPAASSAKTQDLQHFGHILVVYRDGILLRLAVSATNLVPQPCDRTLSKLTPQALQELTALMQEIRSSRCSSDPKVSGSTCPKPSVRRLKKISPQSLRR